MMRLCRLSAGFGFLLVAASAISGTARGEELLDSSVPPEKAIDHYIDLGLQRAGLWAATATDDVNYLRRVMLDLVGRPPTVHEAKEFIAEAAPDKRVQLVDRLLSSPAFVRQQATEFDAWLMEGTTGSIRDYLTRAFHERRSWDRMFREMIVGEPGDTEQQGPIRFVHARVKDAERLASDTSILFFGVNVTCAKCHDHPLVSDWRQDHYYGMQAFFSRTFEVGAFVGERDYGEVSYKTVDGELRDARPMFLTGDVIHEPPSPEPDEEAKQKERKRIEELKKDKRPPPAVGYSRRQVLVDTALRDRDSHFFARAIVNQLWRRLVGRGFVMPADQMHSENPPSHPELLEWLARDLRSSGYNLARLMRGMVLSRAYGRTSQWDSAHPRPADELFAVAQVRPLKPWQYGTLLLLAAKNPDEWSNDKTAAELDEQMEAIEKSGRGFGKLFELPGDDFQIGVDEALKLSNSDNIESLLLTDGPGTLVGRLGRCGQPQEAAELALWTVFTRPPAEGEVESLASYLTNRPDRNTMARQQMVWALLTSSECRFNY